MAKQGSNGKSQASDLTKGEKAKRQASGKFAKGTPGGPGRPPGMRNRSTIDARIARQRLLATWEPVGGDARLIEFAQRNDRNYETYLRVYCGLLPKESDVHVERLNMIAPELQQDPMREQFYDQLVALAAGEPITSQIVLKQLEINSAKRNGSRLPIIDAPQKPD